MMNATRRSLTPAERAVLSRLARLGPDRSLGLRITGRLALYGLIDEGPRGWRITALGRSALHQGRVARPSADDVLRALRPVLATAENMVWSDTDGDADT